MGGSSCADFTSGVGSLDFVRQSVAWNARGGDVVRVVVVAVSVAVVDARREDFALRA
jgi:hypothetical protein